MEIEAADHTESTPRLRVVLDTNVYVAAYLSENPRSPNRELIERWLEGDFVLLFSPPILREIVERFHERGINPKLTERLLSDLLALGEEVSVSPDAVDRVINDDSSDDPILACAVVGRADYLITYDVHFDVLEGRYRGVRITETLPFLYALRKREETA